MTNATVGFPITLAQLFSLAYVVEVASSPQSTALFLALSFVLKTASEIAVPRLWPHAWRQLDKAKRDKVIGNAHHILVMTVLLWWQLTFSRKIFLENAKPWMITSLRQIGIFSGTHYLVEMIKSGLSASPLSNLHHGSAAFICLLGSWLVHAEPVIVPALVRWAYVGIFHATMSQLSEFALFVYRLFSNTQGGARILALVTYLIPLVKIPCHVYPVYVWWFELRSLPLSTPVFFSVDVISVMGVLVMLPLQIYHCVFLLNLHRKVSKKSL
ncbi:hypothetical protein M427DRAFT_354278 [Gonapodya prolifera JEL478]|uniref:TLC domain-containing protein n=1 Tax=Gonapodya prolifera (strain JEL478) TaxID=1344416 RepID=A0A139ABU1_GONPJ|nr:hypothetical protein M427DRAFT_354278 [Gonapodya prolifera JEL478]|eukprot:KXS14074.1 hypothetical protein M427DRAFT_354278 [Gonapodya prolifera JEL478]